MKYSTCSIYQEENEDVVYKALKKSNNEWELVEVNLFTYLK